MRILLIDDDPDIRMLAGFVLEAAGHRLVMAESGREGIAAAADDFDLVLLDYRLGDMTGDQVLRALLGAVPARPVVFLTGADDPAAAQALLGAGAVGMIAKPFDPETLAARVEAFHAGARSRDDSP